MPEQQPQSILAFDFGLRVIGVAVGQTISNSANPLSTIGANEGIPNWDDIAELVQTWHADTLLVGLPLNMDGTPQHLSFCARKFARRLHEKFKLPVFLVDERLTTKTAKLDNPNKKQRLDAIAAQLILQTWLNDGDHACIDF